MRESAVSVKLKQTGDTIIEVLIAMTVASSVLGISYATANRNLLITRASQERSEAARLIQGQIESLRYVNNTAPLTLPSAANTPFCLNGSTVQKSPAVSWPIGVPNTTDLAADNFAGYPAQCVENFYNYAITRDTAGSGTFHFYVRWENVRGGTRDQIIMVYRVN